MPKATLISPVSKQGIQLIRVAAYCRVSSSSADQLNSYATQIDYYTKLAKKKKAEWNLIEIFADEGISGMKAKNRPEFQRMIRMCELHQIDLIVTKSVSRFARNVKEALEYIGYFDVAESPEMLQEWLNDDTISICTGKSGRSAVWIITESHESVIYIDTLEPLSQEEITKEFL